MCWNVLQDSSAMPLKRYILQECVDISTLVDQSVHQQGGISLDYRVEPPPSDELIETIATLIKDIDKYNWLDELCDNGKAILVDLVYLFRLHAYTMELEFVQEFVQIVRSFIDKMQANQGQDEEQSNILSAKMNALLKQCFQSDDPLICCVGRETFLAFSSHFGNDAFEYLIDLICKSAQEEEKRDAEMKEKDENGTLEDNTEEKGIKEE